MEADFEIIDNCYTSDGWYYDGNPGQVDYYIPFAMHFYGLLYAGLMEKVDPDRALTLKKRGAEFIKDYISSRIVI